MMVVSTTKEMYIMDLKASKEGVEISKFLMKLVVVQGASNPLNVYCDNNGAILHVKEPKATPKNKHILKNHHLI